MILVVFEVKLAAGQREHYLALAAALRAELAQIDGFISIERFQSLSDPDTLLSLSCFRDEAAVQAWRSQAAHREGQAQGRASVLPTTACAWPPCCATTAYSIACRHRPTAGRPWKHLRWRGAARTGTLRMLHTIGP